jgi:hypothetical protein
MGEGEGKKTPDREVIAKRRSNCGDAASASQNSCGAIDHTRFEVSFLLSAVILLKA